MANIPKNCYYVNEGFSQNIPQHEFNDLQNCIDKIGNDDRALIQVSSDLDHVDELVFTGARTKIHIDGMSEFNITFNPGLICDVAEDCILQFSNIPQFTGDRIRLHNTESHLKLNNLNTNCSIEMPPGGDTFLTVNSASFDNLGDYPVLNINSRYVMILITNSYLKGGLINPAVSYHSPNNDLTIKNSTLLHGDGVSVPIYVYGSFVPELYLYNCSGPARLSDASVTNWIINDQNLQNALITV